MKNLLFLFADSYIVPENGEFESLRWDFRDRECSKHEKISTRLQIRKKLMICKHQIETMIDNQKIMKIYVFSSD